MRAALVAAALVAAVSPTIPGAGAASSTDEVPPGVVLTRDVSYGPLPEQTLTICRPADVPPATLLPGVVMIHGGAWIKLDKNALLYTCGELAREGMVAATIDYRLADKARPSTLWPAQLADAQLAVRWMRAKAGSIGLDPTRLCAYGESAGGHLATFLAVKATIEPTDMAGQLSDQAVSVECAIDNFGPVDLADPGIRAITEPLMGKPLRHNMAAFQAASPLYFVGRTTPPIFVEQGNGDHIVPPRQSFRLLDRLGRANVTTRFTLYHGGHQWEHVPERERLMLAEEERTFLRLFLKMEAGR